MKDKPKLLTRYPKHYTIVSEPEKQASKVSEFFFVGNDKRIISVLLNNFDSGFCSEDLGKGADIIKMLIARKSSLPDFIIIQAGFLPEDFERFFHELHQQICSIPVVVEGSNTSVTALQQFKCNPFIDDVFSLDQETVGAFIKKIRF